jgi:oxaloacetate decarboxylase alpha subunit
VSVAHIEFVDQTIRDGPQSLWGFKMTCGQMRAVADRLDNAGYHAIEVQAGWTERLVRENKWERFDVIREMLPKSTLRNARLASGTGKMSGSPDSINDLTIKTHIKHGIDEFWVLDCLYNLPSMQRICRVIVENGAKVLPAIMYGDAPSLTDEFFAATVREFRSWGVDGIYVEDAPGIMRPERARTLLPAIVEAAGGLPVELHCHNTTGLAPLNYLEGIEAGIRILHTAGAPLANGGSLPSTEMTVSNLNWLGHTYSLDTSSFEPVAEHFTRVGRQEGLPLGVPVEYDVGVYQHQIPGGMMGSLRSQLTQYNMPEKLAEVLREVPRVRADLGYPVMATPYSQFMGIQAVLNVVTGDRYSMVPDEVISYVLGHFGTPPGPINENVKDRIMALPQAKALLEWEPDQRSLAEIRQAYGVNLSDEELMTRFTVDAADIAATEAAGPIRNRAYTLIEEVNAEALIAELLPRTRVGHLHARIDGLDVSLTRTGCAAHG